MINGQLPQRPLHICEHVGHDPDRCDVPLHVELEDVFEGVGLGVVHLPVMGGVVVDAEVVEVWCQEVLRELNTTGRKCNASL